MSRLANLPEHEKGPGAAVSLPEIFRAKEYVAEIKGALRKGYSFGDLAEIFTGMCGVAISARQLKYHFTREKNKRAKDSMGGKSNPHGASKGDVAPENPEGISSSDKSEWGVGDTETAANVPAIDTPKPVTFGANGSETCSAKRSVLL
jgi:hypothetical protein